MERWSWVFPLQAVVEQEWPWEVFMSVVFYNFDAECAGRYGDKVTPTRMRCQTWSTKFGDLGCVELYFEP